MQTTDYLILVNKDNKIPDDYIESIEFVEITNCFSETFLLEKETRDHFLQLKEALQRHNIHIEITDGFRSISDQESLRKELAISEGGDYVEKYAALPGASEHHTGLALDYGLYIDSKPVEDIQLNAPDDFSMICKMLPKYGFILRYPEGKEHITSVAPEFWHIRYVGVENAIRTGSKTLEEFLEE